MSEVEIDFKSQFRRWGITDSRVQEADKCRVKANEDAAILVSQQLGVWRHPCISHTSIRKSGESQELLRNQLKRFSPRQTRGLSGLDALFLLDITTNLRILTSFFDYFHHPCPKRHRGIISTVNGIHGSGAFQRLEEAVKPQNFPHDSIDAYSRAMDPILTRALDTELIFSSPDFLKVRQELERTLRRQQSQVHQFYSDCGLTSRIGGYHYTFSPSTFGFSFWDENHLLAAIDPARLVCTIDTQGKYEFFTPFTYFIGVHEVGHGIHEVVTRKTMPRGLVPNNSDFLHFVHGNHSEGSVLVMEDMALEHATQNPNRLGFSTDDLRKSALLRNIYVPEALPQKLYNFLQAIEWQDRINRRPDSLYSSAECRLAELTGTRQLRTNRWIHDDEDILFPLLGLSYFYGEATQRLLRQEMEKRRVPRNKQMLALFSGFWCNPDAQRDFVFNYLLPALK